MLFFGREGRLKNATWSAQQANCFPSTGMSSWRIWLIGLGHLQKGFVEV